MKYVSRTARRYARALYPVADEAGVADATVAELTAAARVLDENPDLVRMLMHPRIAFARKAEVARELFGGDGDQGDAETLPRLSDLALRFFELLVRNDRVDLLGQVVAALQDSLDVDHGVARARVTTAVPLLAGEVEMICGKLKELTGAQEIALETRVTKTVIGGVVIHVGEQVIDASVRTYLDRMRERLRRVRIGDIAQSDLLSLDLERIREAVLGSDQA